MGFAKRQLPTITNLSKAALCKKIRSNLGYMNKPELIKIITYMELVKHGKRFFRNK